MCRRPFVCLPPGEKGDFALCSTDWRVRKTHGRRTNLPSLSRQLAAARLAEPVARATNQEPEERATELGAGASSLGVRSARWQGPDLAAERLKK